jgi:serine protease Do
MQPNLRHSSLALCLVLSLGACHFERKPPIHTSASDPTQADASAGGLLACAGKASPFASSPVSSSAGAGLPSSPSAQSGSSNGSPVVALPDFTPLMRINGPAVVNVITSNKPGGSHSRAQSDDPMLEFFRRFMPGPGGPGQGPGGPGQGPGGRGPGGPDLGGPGGPGIPGDPGGAEPRGGLGSGFIVSNDGYILTNAHVVADFDEVTVRLADKKREFKAQVVGIDKRTDVALIKVDATNLPTATLGNSSQLQPGQWVAAIGSPFGFANTITAGIVSATGRSLPDETYVPFIQTDVAVNPGKSGGPLINLKGEVVGINSLIYSRTGGYMGVSFAIPIEVALDVAKELQAHGKVTRGRIGVAIQPLTKDLASSFKLDASSGAVVTAIEPGSPAQKAGLKVGDIILAYNGKKVEDANELPRLVAATKPGAKSQLELWRNGQRQSVSVTIGEIPSEKVASAAEHEPAPKGTPTDVGLSVRGLAPEERKALGVDSGLLVESVGGAAAETPIEPGDVILAVNQNRVGSVEEFNKLVSQHKKGESVALLVRRGDASLFVPIKPG